MKVPGRMDDLKRGRSITSIGLVLVGLLIGSSITYVAMSTTHSPTPVVQTITLPVVFPLMIRLSIHEWI